MTLTVVPGYGRDYTSRAGIEADLRAGMDFLIYDMASRWDGKPANLESLQDGGYSHVRVRYNDKRKVATFSVADLGESK